MEFYDTKSAITWSHQLNLCFRVTVSLWDVWEHGISSYGQHRVLVLNSISVSLPCVSVLPSIFFFSCFFFFPNVEPGFGCESMESVSMGLSNDESFLRMYRHGISQLTFCLCSDCLCQMMNPPVSLAVLD